MGAYIVGGVMAMLVSCCVARLAGGAPLWGLLGPLGWIIAAIRGVQDAIREGHAPPHD